jgi:hypothetical protein
MKNIEILGFLFFPFLGGRTLVVYCDFITQMQWFFHKQLPEKIARRTYNVRKFCVSGKFGLNLGTGVENHEIR